MPPTRKPGRSAPRHPLGNPASRKTYLKRKIVGGVPRRGEVFAPVYASPKSSREVGFVIDLLTGTVTRPLFREDRTTFGKIEPISTATTTGLQRSARREYNKERGVKRERTIAMNVAKEIRAIHAYLVKNPTVFQKPEMRTRFEKKMNEFIVALNPRARNPEKRKAVNRLRDAIELVKSGNRQAILLVLDGVHNDMSARESRVNVQEPRTKRTTKAHERDVKESMNTLRDWMRETRDAMEKVGQSPSQTELNRVAALCERNEYRFRELPATALTELTTIRNGFKAAGVALRANKPIVAQKILADVRQNQIVFYAHHFILPSRILEVISKWPSPAMRAKTISKQIELVGENLVLWSEKGNTAWVHPWFNKALSILKSIPSERSRLGPLYGVTRLIREKKFKQAKSEVEEWTKRE